MEKQEWLEADRSYLMQVHNKAPIAIDHGQGALLYDTDEKEYVDFTGGMGANSLGCGNWQWASAVGAQALRLANCGNRFVNGPAAELAEMLCQRSGMSAALFSNSGAEANEAMIKLARKYSFDKYGHGRNVILTLNHSFHGHTVTTLSAAGQPRYHQYFYPFTDGFRHAEAGDIDSVLDAAGEDVCAVMLELVQTDTGVLPLEREFVHRLAVLCAERDWLLLVDEIHTGIGRTGSLFAYQQYGVLPDALSFADGLAGGLPLGGLLTGEKCRSVLTVGQHDPLSGNPVSCAGALAVLQQLSDEILEEVDIKGDLLRDFVRGLHSPRVAEVSGMGLLTGLRLEHIDAETMAQHCAEHGLLVLPVGEQWLRLTPPLTIDRKELMRGLTLLQQTLCE